LFGDKLEMKVVHCDNQSCIKLIENSVFYDRSKHIDMRYHYIPDLVQLEIVQLQYIAMSEHVVDILTKPLTSRQFVQLRGKLGVAENDSLAEREF
jgi:kynurenine formamidase